MVRRLSIALLAASVLLACEDDRRPGGPPGNTNVRRDASVDGGLDASTQPGEDARAGLDATPMNGRDAEPPGLDAGPGSFDARPPPDPRDAGPAPDAAPLVVTTIAAIQDPNDPAHPASGCTQMGSVTTGQCARAELRGVVVSAVGGFVTTDLRALWVQEVGDADGRFAGVKVIYRANTPTLPLLGEVIDVSGEIVEFMGNTQIRFATLTLTGASAPLLPIVIAPPSRLSRSAPASASEYEGTLVTIRNVAVESPCFEDTSGRDFGYWTVTGDVQIGTAFQYGYNGSPRPGSVMCLDANMNPTGLCGCGSGSRPGDMRMFGDRFASITGVMDFTFDAHQIQPREAADLVR